MLTVLHPALTKVQRWIARCAVAPADSLRFVGAVFLISRALLFAVSCLYWNLPTIFVAHRKPFWEMWHQWDVGYYLVIALHGYTPDRAQDLPAFFPLQGLAERLLMPLTRGDPYAAGMIITNLCWLGALLCIYHLARQDFSERAARGTVIAISAFPTALFTFTPYPESLFLLLASGSFLLMRQGQWGWAGTLGLLAALTRQGGALLALPFAWEYAARHGLLVIQRRIVLLEPSRRSWLNIAWRVVWQSVPVVRLRWRNLRWDALWALAFPAGVALYALWLWHALGDPLAFAHAEASWERAPIWPWLTIWYGFRDLTHETDRFLIFRSAQELLSVLGIGALIVAYWRRVPASYTLLALAFYTLFLANAINPRAGWIMASQSRYMLEIFPIFVALGDLLMRRRWIAAAYLAVCLPVQLVLMGCFVLRYWVF